MSEKVLILGATGSIGSNALEIIKQHPDKYEVQGLVANHNAKGLAELAKRFNVKALGINNKEKAHELKEHLGSLKVDIYAGVDEVCELASKQHDTCVSSIVGIAGLKPTLAAIKGCKKLALANKESIICGGSIILNEAKKNDVLVIPVDSEHNAIFQVFEQDKVDQISKVTITASGGPFKNFTLADMVNITPQQAIKHPNWSMGVKNSVDSATLMNKGLEFIEACILFNLAPNQVNVVIHPQSIIHGMVHYNDGSVLAQLSPPDMKTPISYALAYPERIAIEHKFLDLAKLGTLTFEEPDLNRFPLLGYAKDAIESGTAAQIILNTSNEVAVNAFLEGKIAFLEISKTVANALDSISQGSINSLDDVVNFNAEVFNFTKSSI